MNTCTLTHTNKLYFGGGNEICLVNGRAQMREGRFLK